MTPMFLFLIKMFSCLFPLKEEFSALSIPFPPFLLFFVVVIFVSSGSWVISSMWDHLETKISISLQIIKICIYQNLKNIKWNV